MKERPILFSAPMVRAILDGTKTQTRRAIKAPAGYHFDSLCRASLRHDNTAPYAVQATFIKDGTNSGIWIRCPFTDGNIDDRLWVQEGYSLCPHGGQGFHCAYDADGSERFVHLTAAEEAKYIERKFPLRATPGRFMYRSCSRLTMVVLSVRVERLQDISEEDARAEGAGYYVNGHGFVTDSERNCDGGYHGMGSYRVGFEMLWREINGEASWDANPFVWAFGFARVTP